MTDQKIKVEAAVEHAVEEISAIIRRLASAIHDAYQEEAGIRLIEFAQRFAQEVASKTTVPDLRLPGPWVSNGSGEKPRRAAWGASREAIARTFTAGLGHAGATLADFSSTSRALGKPVALSSLRSMALEMEKRGELRRDNGRWFATRIVIGKGEGAIVDEDPTIDLPKEKEAATPKPFAEGAAASTSQDAADAGPVSAG